MLKHTLVLTGALALLLCGMKPATAQLSLTFAPDTESGPPNSTVTFSGTLTNTGTSTFYITSDSISLLGLGLMTDDSKFSMNAPLSLNGGDATGVIELFDVSIDPTTGLGSYPGSFSVLGGTTMGAQDMQVTTNFFVTVAPAAPPAPPVDTPEPGSLALLSGLGVTSAGMLARRRSRLNSNRRNAK